MTSDDLKHMTEEQLKKALDDALGDAKRALDRAADHADKDVADAVGRAISIWKELQERLKRA